MTTWGLIVACGLVLALPSAARIARHRFDPFEPIVLFALAYGAMFVARPASVISQGPSKFWGVDVLPTLQHALVIAVVGAAAFVAGYELRWGRALSSRLPAPRLVDTRVAAGVALGTSCAGLAALLAFLPISDGLASVRILFDGRNEAFGEAYGSSSTYVSYGSLLFAPASFVLTGLALRDRSKGLALAALVLLAFALARVGPMGGRIVLLPLLGGMLVLAYVMRGRRPGALVLSLIAVAALLGSYFTLSLRDPTDDLTLASTVSELGDRPQAILDPVLRGADAEMVMALSAALTVVPDELPHRWGGATIGNLLTRPIPRELWPGKPRPPGEVIVARVWPKLYPGLDPAFSPLLVFYWDFGLAGVAVGMALLGLVARTFYEWFLRHRGEFAAQLLFAGGLWFVVIAARNDPVDTTVFSAFLFAPILVAVVLAADGVLTTARAPGDPRRRGCPSDARSEGETT